MPSSSQPYLFKDATKPHSFKDVMKPGMFISVSKELFGSTSIVEQSKDCLKVEVEDPHIYSYNTLYS